MNDFKEVVQRTCFVFLPENFIYALIMSEDQDTQIKGWNLIKQMRSMPPASDDLREKIPKINWKASTWSSKVDLTQTSSNLEPPLVSSFNYHDIEDFCKYGTTYKLDDLPCHSQGLERAVKLVSETCRMVYREKNRHNVILTVLKSRNLRPSFDSIGSYFNNYDDLFCYL